MALHLEMNKIYKKEKTNSKRMMQFKLLMIYTNTGNVPLVNSLKIIMQMVLLT